MDVDIGTTIKKWFLRSTLIGATVTFLIHTGAEEGVKEFVQSLLDRLTVTAEFRSGREAYAIDVPSHVKDASLAYLVRQDLDEMKPPCRPAWSEKGAAQFQKDCTGPIKDRIVKLQGHLNANQKKTLQELLGELNRIIFQDGQPDSMLIEVRTEVVVHSKDGGNIESLAKLLQKGRPLFDLNAPAGEILAVGGT